MNAIQHKSFFIFICCALILGLFLHFWRLSVVPMSFYYDEMDYIVTGEAVARFGTDLSGSWRPEQLLPLKTLNVTAELPAVFHAIFQKLFGYGVEVGRYPATFFGLMSIIVCGFITQLLFKDKRTSILVILTMLLSPWHVHISRSGYEAMIAVFFQLTFISTVLVFIDSRFRFRWKLFSLFFALVSMCIGFYTYHAAKFVFIALGFLSILLVWGFQKNKRINILFTVSIFAVITLLSLRTYALNKEGVFAQRQTETIIDSVGLSERVDFLRRESLYLPGSSLFINKGTVLAESLIKHYLAVFDIYRLAINGLEGTYQFSLIVHGFFYLSTIILVGIAFWAISTRFESKIVPFLAFFFVSPIASTISVGYQSIFRSSLTYSLLLVLAGIGLSTLLFQLTKKFPRHAISFQIVIYFILLSEAIIFGFRYFSQYPIMSADNQYFFEKLLASYTVRQKEPILVVSENFPYTYARSYIAYNNLMPQLTISERLQFNDAHRDTYTIGQVTFTQDCPGDNIQNSPQLQIIEPAKYKNCGYELQDQESGEKVIKRALGSPIDSRPYFYLRNDHICDGADLRTFIYTNQLADFNVNGLSDLKFCEKWVRIE